MRDLPLVFAVHPRTRKKLEDFALLEILCSSGGQGQRKGKGPGARVTVTEPLGYVQFMNLVCSARAVITDSGGVQEESTYLGIPCLTLRENTERPITVSEGSNRLVRPEDVADAVRDILRGRWPTGRRPALWRGRTAERCVEALRRRSGA